MTRVVHRKKDRYDVPIDRSTKWGNPFTHVPEKTNLARYVVGSREEAVEAYRQWITNGEGRHLLADLHELKGKVLGCWCSPNACHGDVLAELADAMVNETANP